jgi:K+-sensing histidine kinase KdpD
MRPTAAQTAGAARLPGLLRLAGSVHPPEQAEAALDGWFRIGPLSALRKLTLLRLACGVPDLAQGI